MIYEVKYIRLVEQMVTCTVEANSEEEAIQKGAHDGLTISMNADECPENTIEIKHAKAKLITGT